MKDEYLLVHKSILPTYYLDVIKCRELVEGKNMSVSDACKICNISRSTYYKYKDYVYLSDENKGKHITLSCRLHDKQGVLSSVLNTISSYKCNILTINQNMPINNIAQIILSINISEITISVDQLIEEINKISGVKLVEMVGVK
jgi:chorismate mutase